jgi:hypothetical protein
MRPYSSAFVVMQEDAEPERILRAMTLRVKFWKWTMFFGALGLLVPVAVSAQYVFSGAATGLGGWLGWLWPSSMIFMGLDGPSPAPSTVAFVWALAYLGNVVLYAVIGAMAWIVVRGVLNLRGARGDSTESL